MIAPMFVNSSFVGAPERFVLAGGRWSMVRLQVRFGYFDHPRFGPVLIDTGYTPRVTTGKYRSLPLKLYAGLVRAELCKAGQVLTFLKTRGIEPADIRKIIVTHFHADHVSGLCDFPNARFLAPRAGWDALNQNSKFANIRHGFFVELLPPDFSDRLDFFDESPPFALPDGTKGHDLFGDGVAVSVDLPGHAPGHTGLFFGALDQPLLYATDVQWMRQAVVENRVPGFPATRVATDQRSALFSTGWLQTMAGKCDFLLCHQPDVHRFDLINEQA